MNTFQFNKKYLYKSGENKLPTDISKCVLQVSDYRTDV